MTGLCQLRPAQMKALESTVGGQENSKGEARSPRRGQGLEVGAEEEGVSQASFW